MPEDWLSLFRHFVERPLGLRKSGINEAWRTRRRDAKAFQLGFAVLGIDIANLDIYVDY